MGGSNSAEAPKEDEDPPINVDTGDSVKVKQTLDEAVVKAVLDHGYEEHHSLDNAKLLLMLVACSFAMVAQFWPIPFPASRPLLGYWELPRLTAWPATRNPKVVMQEFAVRHYAKGGVRVESSAWPVNVDADGTPEANTPFESAARTNAWLLGRAAGSPPLEALYDEERECHVLSGSSRTRKKHAEHDALLTLMRALSDASPSPPWVPLDEVLHINGATAAESAAAAGSTVTCSYTLFLDPDGTGDAMASGCVKLEAQSELEVVLGAGVLHPKVEEAVAEVAGAWQALNMRTMGSTCDGDTSATPPTSLSVRIRARYHGLEVWCVLVLTVHGVARGKEESEYEMSGGAEGLGALRMQKLHELLHELRPTCLADVGCGDGSFMVRLLERGAPPSLARLVGVDVNARALRSGAKKLCAAREKLIASNAGAGGVPSVQMLRASLAEMDAANSRMSDGRLHAGIASHAATR